jgi:thioredoxin-dependent peroxiredoxin
MAFRRVENSVHVGSEAPDFTLRSQSGEWVSLKGFLGSKPVVLFFYPKDDTLGCTKQVCAVRDEYGQFGTLQAEVLGISSDSVESHRRFAENNGLPFPLLSDEGDKVRELYGVPKTLGLLPGRVTYVIDRDGVVRHVFSSQVAVHRHVEEALGALEILQQERA